MVYYIIKLVLEFQFDLQNPLKQPKMWIFEKWKIIVFGQNYGIFWPKGDLKPCIIMYLGNIHNMSLIPVTFGNLFSKSSNPSKLPSKNKVPWHWPGAVRSRRSNCLFFFKKCIFRAENEIFLKSSLSTKIISGPKYRFSIHQKYFFGVLLKINIFHHSEPT